MSAVDRVFAEARREAAHSWLLREDGSCHVKLCGMFREDDIRAVNACLPDMVGFVTGYPESHCSLTAPQVRQLTHMVDERVYRVGVSVNLPIDHVVHNARYHVDLVQLNGSEDTQYIDGIRALIRVGIIQTFRIQTKKDVEQALSSSADMVLLDVGKGTSVQFDGTLIDGFSERRPFILAGSLTPDNVAEAIADLHPWGVDFSSGIETNQVKDPEKMAAAIDAVRGI